MTEEIRNIVDEGRNARNILSWRVPNDPSPRQRIDIMTKSNENLKQHNRKNNKQLRDSISSLPSDTASDSQSEDPNGNVQNRLWNYLFANINAATDELYYLCSEENDRERCVEGVELFAQCKRDFEKLIERMDEQKRFENDQQKGVSWEVRKTALGKPSTLLALEISPNKGNIQHLLLLYSNVTYCNIR
jgi:hypothetical protein